MDTIKSKIKKTKQNINTENKFAYRCLKTIETKVLFTKTQMNNEWNINFQQNSPLNIQRIYSSKFSICQSTPFFDRNKT